MRQGKQAIDPNHTTAPEQWSEHKRGNFKSYL